MKISIVTPSYNQAHFLRKTIESILSQEGDFDLEYIVMDGGSTDGSVDVLKEFEGKLKSNRKVKFIWKSEKDKGQSDAINKGLRMATGEIVAFLNSDDVYTKGTFRTISDLFSKNPNSNWLTGYCQIIDENSKSIQNPIMKYKNFWLNRYSYRKLQVLNFVSQPSTFWRRSLIAKYGLFDEKLHYTMDYDYWLRIGQSGRPLIVKKPLSCFRIHSSSKGKTQYVKQFEQDLETCIKYTNSPYLISLHRLHNFLIKTVYKIIK